MSANEQCQHRAPALKCRRSGSKSSQCVAVWWRAFFPPDVARGRSSWRKVQKNQWRWAARVRTHMLPASVSDFQKYQRLLWKYTIKSQTQKQIIINQQTNTSVKRRTCLVMFSSFLSVPASAGAKQMDLSMLCPTTSDVNGALSSKEVWESNFRLYWELPLKICQPRGVIAQMRWGGFGG